MDTTGGAHRSHFHSFVLPLPCSRRLPRDLPCWLQTSVAWLACPLSRGSKNSRYSTRLEARPVSTCLDLPRPLPTAANWPPQYAVPVCHMCRFSRGGPNTSTLSGFCRLLAVLMRSCLLPLRRRKTCLENSIHKYVAAYSRSCNLICVTSNASRGKKTWRSRALPCSFYKSQNSMSRLQSNNHNGAQERGRLAPGALAGRSTGPSRAHGLIIAAQSSLM